MALIDVHAHVVLEGTFGAAGPYGPELRADGVFRAGSYELRGVRYRDSPFMDLELRLAAMDSAGIDVQVLSPNPLTFFHDLPPGPARDFCQRHNDELAPLRGDRLYGLAALPLPDVAASVAELRRAVRELGLLGAYVGTDPGVALEDPGMDDLYACCVELDVPLFLHPVPRGESRFDLDLVVGFAADETRAVATLILGGVLERHPLLDVCVSHGGGSAAFLAGRLDAAARQRPWAFEELRELGAGHYLRRLWFDTHVHSAGALRLLREVADPGRLVYGTNFAGWDQGAGEAWPELEANAAALLRLPGPFTRVR